MISWLRKLSAFYIAKIKYMSPLTLLYFVSHHHRLTRIFSAICCAACFLGYLHMAWIHWLAAICRAPLRAGRIISSREIQLHFTTAAGQLLSGGRELQLHISCGSAALWGSGASTPHQLRVSCSLGVGRFNSTPAAGQLLSGRREIQLHTSCGSAALWSEASTSLQQRVSCSLGAGGRELQLHTSCVEAALWAGASTSHQLRGSCSLVGSFNFTPAAWKLLSGRELQLHSSCGSATPVGVISHRMKVNQHFQLSTWSTFFLLVLLAVINSPSSFRFPFQ